MVATENRREAMRKYANGLRVKAIEALGRVCMTCGEENPFLLLVTLLTKEVKRLDQLKAYKVIIDREDRKEIAGLYCLNCRALRRDVYMKCEGKEPLNDKTGQVHWIAGEKVIKRRGYDDTPEHLLITDR